MPDLIKIILLLISSYLIGSIPMAYLAVKWRYGVDIRNYGSGQVGASNIFRTFSKLLSIPVGIFDVGKGALMVWIAHLLGLGLTWEVAAGLAVTAGHNWPVFLNFNAGRGIATTFGIVAYLFPWGILIFVAAAFFTLILGSSPWLVLIGLAALPLSSWLLHEPLALTLGFLAFFLLMIVRRITVPRSARSASTPTRELLLNRFLFDRDIRDAKTWIRTAPDQKPNFQRKG